MVIERLLGFDIRALSNLWDESWPPARRQVFLLRQDVQQPLSTDTMVWPSAFDVRDDDCPGRLERRFLQYLWHDDLWADLGALSALRDRYFCHEPSSSFSFVTAAFTLVACDAADNAQLHRLRGTVVPASLDRSWTHLGYDVSDRWFLSGLSNCGHDTSDALINAELKAKWAAQLNVNHLFGSPDDAHSFREVANRDIPEHSPFYVYGIRSMEFDQEQ